MSFYKLWATRVNAGNINSDQYVGQAGKLFYDTEDRIIRISDGVTVGGIPINSGGAGGNVSLADLSDVSISGAVNGQVLQFNGNVWVPGTVAGAGGGHTISSEGTLVSANVADVNFTGNLVTVVESPAGQVTVNIDSSLIPDTFISQTFETLSKNLKAYPFTISYSGEQISSVTYTTGIGTILKAIAYTGTSVANITITGTNLGNTYVKTLGYDGNSRIISASYSVS